MARYEYQLPDKAQFKKLNEYDNDTVIDVRGFLSYNTKFGTTVAIITDGVIIPLPKAKVNEVEKLMFTKSVTDYINSGLFTATVVEYTNKYGTFKTVDFNVKG